MPDKLNNLEELQESDSQTEEIKQPEDTQQPEEITEAVRISINEHRHKGITSSKLALKDFAIDGELAIGDNSLYDFNNERLGIGTTSPSNKVDIVGGNLSLNSNKIIDVTDPASAQDAATKNYVDNSILFTSSSAIAGESISEHDIVCFGDDTTNSTVFSQTTGGAIAAFGVTQEPGTDKREIRQEIKSGDIANSFNAITVGLKKGNSPSDVVNIEIRKASDTSLLASGSIDSSDLSGIMTDYTIDLDNYVSAQDIYVYYDRSGSDSDTNYYVCEASSTDEYATTNIQFNGDSGWTDDSGDITVSLIDRRSVRFLYQADANNSDDIERIAGIATESETILNDCTFQRLGTHTQAGWGLSTGSAYYLSDTAGDIDTSPGTNAKLIGIAESATELYLLL